jgi:hypothetical protein
MRFWKKRRRAKIAPLSEEIRPAISLAQALHSRNDQYTQSTAKEAPKTGQALLDSHGFPADIVEAFSLTAKETNCVIMCRAPGGAVKTLVEHGHDLKSYQIKAKSCDWGPMSGFLCQLTCFNKYGNEKIEYNDENYIKYFEFIRDNQKNDEVFRKAIQGGQTAFIPLKLFDQRKIDILADVKSGILAKKRLDNGNVVGLAEHREDPDIPDNKTAVMEFLLKKEGTNSKGEILWGVYHGRVVFRNKDNANKWENFLKTKISTMKETDSGYKLIKKSEPGAMKVESLIEVQPTPMAKLGDAKPCKSPKARELLNKFKNYELAECGAGTNMFYPVCVAQNPYPPFKDRDKRSDEEETATEYAEDVALAKKDLYKNAVTGDYDLFSVWPVRPKIGWKDLRRFGDYTITLEDRQAAKAEERSLKERNVDFFLRVGAKPFALETRAREEVYIEVIPGYKEIGLREDTEIGNINPAVAEVVQYLNTFIYSMMLEKVGGSAPKKYNKNMPEHRARDRARRNFSYANVAFHSDEGGRPGIDEIDFPVGVFLPPSMFSDTDKSTDRFTVFDEREYDRFLKLCMVLRDHCFVMFNHVWITRLFALVATPKDLKNVPEGTTKYFKEVAEEREKMKDGPQLKAIRSLLSELFLKGQLRVKFLLDSQSTWGGVVSVGKDVAPDMAGQEVVMAEKSMDSLLKAFIASTGKVQAKHIRKVLQEAKITIPDRRPKPKPEDDE